MEAVNRDALLKTLFLKTSQNSHENTCVGVGLYVTLLKKRLQHNCLNTFFAEDIRVTASNGNPWMSDLFSNQIYSILKKCFANLDLYVTSTKKSYSKEKMNFSGKILLYDSNLPVTPAQ